MASRNKDREAALRTVLTTYRERCRLIQIDCDFGKRRGEYERAQDRAVDDIWRVMRAESPQVVAGL